MALRWYATAPINFDLVRAFNVGDHVPDSIVAAHPDETTGRVTQIDVPAQSPATVLRALLTSDRDTDAERENFVPSRLSDVSLRAAYGPAASVRPPTAHVGRVPGGQPTVRSYRPEAAVEISTPAINSVYAIDSANLAVTFVVPPSGLVDVTLSAFFATAAAGGLEWWLQDSAGPLAYTGVRAGLNIPNQTAATRTIRVDKDSTGAALVPGRTMTLIWAHSSGGDIGQTVYGGGYGAATMRVEPVSNRLTERQVTVTERATNTHVPLWLSHDRTTLLGSSVTPARLAWSTDDGVTWTEHSKEFSSALGLLREMDNGELVVFCGQGDGGAVYVSSGWAANKATATFTKTLDFTGSPPEVSYGAHPAPWSVDTYGPIVLAAEYGPKNGTADMARYCYLSEDYGQTWRVIFDLAEKRPGNGSLDAHLHGVCYDPWWDAIWLTHGDNAQRGTWVSYDRGDTWLEIPVGGLQFTTILPLPECILLVSDITPDGIYRIPRDAKDAPRIELALRVGTSFNMIGIGWFRARSLPDAPVLMAAYGANNNPGRVWATYDGYTFREVWADSIGYQDRGAQIAVGPTTKGTYHLHVIRDDQTGPVRKHLVLTPS